MTETNNEQQTTNNEQQVEVTIKDAFTLGLMFGAGFGLAMIFYVIIAVVVAKEFIHAVLF